MCGIAGVFGYRGSEVDDEEIGRMLSLIRHRGPDDEGSWVEPHVAIGNRRLSIIDIAGGHQPMTNEDGSVVVVFNGEIYNYKELAEPAPRWPRPPVGERHGGHRPSLRGSR
jgi:asparagine synthase (glutamine-hydrolysing)